MRSALTFSMLFVYAVTYWFYMYNINHLHPGFFPIIKPKNNAVVEAAEEVYGVEVVPNPTRGRAAVHSKRAIRSVAVSDMGGHEMMRKTFGGEQYIADLPEFPKGCYVVTVETVQGIAVKKLVVE